MRHFADYVANAKTIKYVVDKSCRDNFIEFLRVLKDDTGQEISILDSEEDLLVSAPKFVHDRIDIICKN